MFKVLATIRRQHKTTTGCRRTGKYSTEVIYRRRRGQSSPARGNCCNIVTSKSVNWVFVSSKPEVTAERQQKTVLVSFILFISSRNDFQWWFTRQFDLNLNSDVVRSWDRLSWDQIHTETSISRLRQDQDFKGVETKSGAEISVNPGLYDKQTLKCGAYKP